MDEIKKYIDKSRTICDVIEAQSAEIETAAQWFSKTIIAGRMVHVFGVAAAPALAIDAHLHV